jgi:hypothetical protein
MQTSESDMEGLCWIALEDAIRLNLLEDVPVDATERDGQDLRHNMQSSPLRRVEDIPIDTDGKVNKFDAQRNKNHMYNYTNALNVPRYDQLNVRPAGELPCNDNERPKRPCNDNERPKTSVGRSVYMSYGEHAGAGARLGRQAHGQASLPVGAGRQVANAETEAETGAKEGNKRITKFIMNIYKYK